MRIHPYIPRLLLVLVAAASPAAAGPLLSEVVTDPQQDHSENRGGNGTPFDLLPGTGTISSVDEFVEIVNSGTEVRNLRGATLDMLDTSPTRYVFGTTTGGRLFFSGGSTLDAFLPGTFALLGNPPGAMNNRVLLELRDANGVLWDAFSLLDGNATNVADESWSRSWTARGFGDTWHASAITPLAPTRPLPEPGAFWLCGLALLSAGLRSRRRRAARGPHRKPPAEPVPL